MNKLMMMILGSLLRESNPDGASAPAAPAIPAPASAEPAIEEADAPEAPPAAPTPGDEPDFAALAKDFESDNEDLGDVEEPSAPAPQPAVAQPEPTAPVVVQPQPVAPIAATPVPPVQPSAAVPAPAPAPTVAQPQVQPQPAVPQPEAITPEKIEAAYEQYQAQILPQLEKHYALSPEQVTEIEENPSQAIPKLAARIHYHAQIAAYTGIMSQIPRIIGTMVERHQAVNAADTKFKARWPLLADPKYAQQVDTTLRTFRAVNKDISTDEMIEKAGLIAMMSLGLAPTAMPQPSVPAQPVLPARPAGVGGSMAPAQRGSVNPFEQLAENWEDADS